MYFHYTLRCRNVINQLQIIHNVIKNDNERTSVKKKIETLFVGYKNRDVTQKLKY